MDLLNKGEGKGKCMTGPFFYSCRWRVLHIEEVFLCMPMCCGWGEGELADKWKLLTKQQRAVSTSSSRRGWREMQARNLPCSATNHRHNLQQPTDTMKLQAAYNNRPTQHNTKEWQALIFSDPRLSIREVIWTNWELSRRQLYWKLAFLSAIFNTCARSLNKSASKQIQHISCNNDIQRNQSW